MKKLYLHISLSLSLLLYISLWIFLHPYLGYILDNDGVAYLTIAKRVANGQYLESINGLWSSFNSWMLVPFIKQGMDAWLVSKALNCFLGACVIVLVHFHFIRFKISTLAHYTLLFALAIVMVHNVYLQMFGDVLQLIFVLLYLLILWSENFITSYYKTVLCGIIMSIAYYAKSYSLMFFMLHFSVMLFWFYKKSKLDAKKAFKLYFIGVFTSILCVLPWTYALHEKYNEWSLSGFAGKLNMSWYINGGKTFRSDIKLLIPPGYSDSPSFWEDPYPSQENLSSPLSSAKHFVKWMARVIHTVLVAVNCFNEISFLALAILSIALYYFFFRKIKPEVSEDNFHIQLLVFTILILPLGYLMMHIETRYIWLNIFLIMILGGKLIQRSNTILQPLFYKSAIILFAISFIVFPILNIENLKFKNKRIFEQARLLNQQNIKGSFTSNVSDAGSMWILAYLTHNSFYTIERSDYTIDELLSELKRYEVKYYLYSAENNKPTLKLDETNFRFVMKVDGFDLYEIIRKSY